MQRNEQAGAALDVPIPDRRSNPYDLEAFRNSPLGVFIVENGFQVCETHRGICPVPAVSDWERAMELLDVLTRCDGDRRKICPA